ncbi:hypothetical protein VaNZ11_003947 [Volvox africanus]|uniref:Uncharacterized protein n=1 Tax=Volvox africanus TaxID=51714 RepID=A0ABQ5RWB3_9CHLO|nr:hypothetical protein VaNZ11_003947 [Volvox africanus]
MGGEPNEAEILMYGGCFSPLFVGGWHLGGDLKSDTAPGEDDYLPINVAVSCADGSVFKADTNSYKQVIGPVLTDEEIKAKHRYTYDKYSKVDPSPTINFTFVVLLVMRGLRILLAIPYFLRRKKKVPRVALYLLA